MNDTQWLKSHYFLRAAVSILWIVLAVTLGKSTPPLAAALLLAYPAWDAFANLLDARRHGGLSSNPTQALNVLASSFTTMAVAFALSRGMHAVLGVFGIWAILAGLFQFGTALRRRHTQGAQWPMILSGAQSVLAGTHMGTRAAAAQLPTITDIAPYAAFGAFYFLLSAFSLAQKKAE